MAKADPKQDKVTITVRAPGGKRWETAIYLDEGETPEMVADAAAAGILAKFRVKLGFDPKGEAKPKED